MVYRCGRLLLSPSPQQGVDGIVVQQPALPVQAYQFAAGAESGVQGQDVLLAQGRGQKQMSEVVGEYFDGGVLSANPSFSADLRFHGGFQQSLVAVLNRQPDLLRGIGVPGDEDPLQHRNRPHDGRRDMDRQ